MIVTKITKLVDYVQNEIRMRVFKTLEDPVTKKEYLSCEVYTKTGAIQDVPKKGDEVDKKA